MSLTELIISSLAVAIMGLSGAVYGALRSKVARLEDTKVERNVCDERHRGISEDIHEVKTTLTEVNHSVRRIEIQLARMSSRPFGPAGPGGASSHIGGRESPQGL
jgi:hypothetical protein